MADRLVIQTDNAPPAIGPYSQGIAANGFVFTAGQGGVDPATRQLVEGGVQAQTRQTLQNLAAILEAAGCSLADVVKTTVYLADMDDFAAMNAIYATFFPANPPARTTIQAARLPMGLAVEIEAVALLP
jgi:2-iminobutanoate/2-iminopropanoate deaminase